MRLLGETSIGLQRTHNEDYFHIGKKLPGNATWCVICDGMGGANAGQIASKTAGELISKHIEDNYFNGIDIKQMLNNAIINANAEIFVDSKENKSHEGMGTTVVIAFFVNNKAIIAHVGDSRAYIVSPTEIEAVTTDHSVVQTLIDDGKISVAEAREHPQKNIITRALGVNPTVKADFNSVTVGPDEILLLCTDGLSSLVEDKEIQELMINNDFEQLPELLVERANQSGGVDNTTVIVARQEK